MNYSATRAAQGRVLVLLIIVAAVLASAGCSRSQSELPLLDANATVLAFGDSITRGNGAGVRESYPAVLGELIGRRVINAGKAGELSRDGLKRLPGLLASYSPRLVILTHGGNDLLRLMDKRETEENLRQMILLIQRQGVSVVLVGVPEPGIMLSPPDLYTNLAEQFNLPYEDDVLSYIYRRASLKSDPIHPNARGYRKLAQSLAELLREGGALE
jgi:lysophospholipase L1-like esterase